jgi:luciferase family oxidoreductase group 1
MSTETSASTPQTTSPKTPQLRLSVLDQAPVPDGFSATDALNNSLSLARHVDHLGYTRLWYSEHHAMPLLAGSAPEILITRAAAATSRIRVGSGGIMLPHYSALKVAEVFRTLDAMFPNRIDLGLGRAPGGGQLEAYALKRERSTPPKDDFPQQLAELRAFLDPTRWDLARPAGDPRPHPFRNIHVSPSSPTSAPDIWLLGSSMWSSVTAANEGLPYAFAHFFSPIATRQAIEYYQRNFIASKTLAAPKATIAIGVICAPTDEEAQHLHASVRLLQRRIRMDDRRPVATPEDALRELGETPTAPNPLIPFTAGSFDAPEDSEFPRYVIGTPDKVAARLRDIAASLHLDELIINTITHSHEARLRSYQLLANQMGLASSM